MDRKRKHALWAAALCLALCAPAQGTSAHAAQKPGRLIAMTLASAEMLVDLVERRRIVGLHKLAADAAYSNIADRVRGIPLIASAPESVISLRPDVVFVASYSSAGFLKHLRAAGVPVFQFSAFSDVEDIFGNILRMGRAVGEEERARNLVRRGRERIRAIRARIPRRARPPRILPLTGGGWAPGRGTSLDAMIRLAGGENVAAARGVRGGRRISAEQAIAWNPDVILVGADPVSGRSLKAALRARAAYAPLREKRIIEMPSPRLSSVSHHIVDGLAVLVRALYP